VNPELLRLIARRVAACLATLLVVSVLVFIATGLLPGDVTEAILGQSASPEAVAGLRRALNLDEPAPVRYVKWLGGLLSGDPGLSLVNRVPVAQLIASRIGNSLVLAGLTAAVAVPFALLLGVTAAVWRNTAYDRGANLFAVSSVSVPEFLTATVAVILFAVQLRWLPALSVPPVRLTTFGEWFRNFALPVLTLTLGMIAQMARMTRAALVTVLDSSYVEMARLKGARPARIVLRHALPNAAGPIANAVALSLSSLLGGVIIVETVFGYPGLARLMVDAVTTRDMPLVQACAMIFCAAYMGLVLIADTAALLSNPRLRHR
jgi:peptide/nickel transport system permease protein